MHNQKVQYIITLKNGEESISLVNQVKTKRLIPVQQQYEILAPKCNQTRLQNTFTQQRFPIRPSRQPEEI